MGLILLIVLLVLVFGAWPGNGAGFNQGWGNGPSGLLGLVLVIVLILVLLGHVPAGF